MVYDLKEFRLAKKWSQERLATEISRFLGTRKLGQTHVSAYERGVMPGWDVGEAIQKATGGKVKATSFLKDSASEDGVA